MANLRALPPIDLPFPDMISLRLYNEVKELGNVSQRADEVLFSFNSDENKHLKNWVIAMVAVRDRQYLQPNRIEGMD